MITLAALSLPLAIASAPLAALQSAGDAAIAIKNDDPETWVVEYPRIIRPYVQDYRRCLNVSNRRVTGVADFEEQHRSDIPRCEEEREEAAASAMRVLDGAKTTMSSQEIATLFDNIGRIHVARGRDLDDQFKQRLTGADRAQDAYYAERERKGLVIEMRDASVVKSRMEIEGRTAPDNNPNKEAGDAGY